MLAAILGFVRNFTEKKGEVDSRRKNRQLEGRAGQGREAQVNKNRACVVCVHAHVGIDEVSICFFKIYIYIYIYIFFYKKRRITQPSTAQ